MYWLIGKVNPFIDKLNNNLNSQDFLRDFESFDAHAYYQTNYKHQDEIDNSDLIDTSTFNNDLSSINDDSLNSNIQNNNKQYPSKPRNVLRSTNNKLKRDHSVAYSRIIKGLDVLGIICIIFSFGLNIAESNDFFQLNKPTRIIGVILLNYMNDFPNNNTWNTLIHSNFNLSDLILRKDNEVPFEASVANYANNFLNTGRDYYSNITNEDIIIAYNISPSMYNYQENSTYYNNHNFIIPFKSNKQIDEYRKVILALSGLLMIISFLTNYLHYLLLKENGVIASRFYRTKLLYYFIFDLIVFSINPYPSFFSSFYYKFSGSIKCYPYSIYFSMLVNFRLFYLVKILKFSFWNNDKVKEKCQYYQVKHSLFFVFKCFEMTHPFLVIFCILSAFAIIFGINIRLSEIYFYDTQLVNYQNWENYFNALWFVATTMMSLGYGDYYPATHMGRFLTIFVCISGIYVVTMLMVNFSKESVLKTKEEKVYTLIKRLNYKAKIKEEHSLLIYYSFQSILINKKNSSKHNDTSTRTRTRTNTEYYYKRQIYNCLKRRNAVQREIRKYDFVPNKEMLIDLIEKLETDIREIDKEVIVLQKLNHSVTEFLGSLKTIMSNMKHSVISTKKLFNLIDKTGHTFGKLHNYSRRVLIEEFGVNYASNKALRKYFDNQKGEENLIFAERRRTNPNQFENFIIKPNEEEENNNSNTNNNTNNSFKNSNFVLDHYDVTSQEFMNHFQNLFFESSTHNKIKPYAKYNSVKTSQHKKLHTDQIFKKIKNNNVTFLRLEEKKERKGNNEKR